MPPDSIAPTEAIAIPKYNRAGGLLNDDPNYNPRAPVALVSARVVSSNIFNWALNRYYFKADWTASGIPDWKRNLREGPEWDDDGFGINFIGHPHTGSFYFNAARSNGYNYWQSIPFAMQGSILWEWFGENLRPSYNDLINTPFSGAFWGEVFYRVTSSLLDDRKRGGERIVRESLTAIINPTRSINRLTSGSMFRVVPHEIYQKEPIHVTMSGGLHKVNPGHNSVNNYDVGQTNAMLQMLIDYGDPFEQGRDRKPFDVFRFRIELSEGDNDALIDNVMGFGLLKGKTVGTGKLKGFFQHYDYWRYNEVFEIGSMGFGVGMINKTPLGKRTLFRSVLHAAIVPLAGNNNPFLPDSTEFRAYNFGGGLQTKLEGILEISNRVSLGMRTYQYFITTYSGTAGNSLVGILKPSITVRLFSNLHLGFEHHIYHNDRYRPGGRAKFHITRTEQKFFMQWRFREY
ncbi:MAG TPA: DUF3943 domain-containing protein [Flavisolibacter sp.]